jgi:hypothetical protein
LTHINTLKREARSYNAAQKEAPMANKATISSVQNELLDVYEQASRAWLTRMKSEVDLWSDLATRLTATHSIPEAMSTYQQCMTHRMQMAADDGRRLYEDCQKISQKITDSLSHGLPTASS